jgi:hypothetical protein
MKVRTRRRITVVSVAVSFLCLLAAVLVPRIREHAAADGLLIAVSAAVSIVSGLAYLRSTRNRP